MPSIAGMLSSIGPLWSRPELRPSRVRGESASCVGDAKTNRAGRRTMALGKIGCETIRFRVEHEIYIALAIKRRVFRAVSCHLFKPHHLNKVPSFSGSGCANSTNSNPSVPSDLVRADLWLYCACDASHLLTLSNFTGVGSFYA